jgi:hypothetical protein
MANLNDETPLSDLISVRPRSADAPASEPELTAESRGDQSESVHPVDLRDLAARVYRLWLEDLKIGYGRRGWPGG